MSDTITRDDYWREIGSIAESVTEDAYEWEQELSDRLWEAIDGHQWVIYTAYNWEVLAISPSDGAYVENFGADGVVRDGALNTAALAYAAMEQDVRECTAFGQLSLGHVIDCASIAQLGEVLEWLEMPSTFAWATHDLMRALIVAHGDDGAEAAQEALDIDSHEFNVYTD